MPYTIKKLRKSQLTASSTAGLITFDQYYALVDETTRADLLDGKIIRDSPAIPRHGLVVSWINTLLTTFAQDSDIGVVLGATCTVRLTSYNAPEPDILFVCKPRVGIIKETTDLADLHRSLSWKRSVCTRSIRGFSQRFRLVGVMPSA